MDEIDNFSTFNSMQLELDKIYLGDCLQLLKAMPDKSVDLVVTDPPYLIENKGGGFWSKSEDNNHYNARGTRKGMDKLSPIKDGIQTEILDELYRVMKKTNIYLFCSQKQIPVSIEFFAEVHGCNWNLLSWHKTNPIPACGNKYLNDTEYIMFFREKGVKLYGSYDTKRTFYTSLRNQEDNVRYEHPTVKPLNIIKNLIVNSSMEGDVVLDPFCGSGTTCVAAAELGRHYIGMEIDKKYHSIACERVKNELAQLTLF